MPRATTARSQHQVQAPAASARQTTPAASVAAQQQDQHLALQAVTAASVDTYKKLFFAIR